jgi:hypothetical protein
MCSRLSKKNVITWLGWMSFNVMLYAYVLNNMRHQRKADRM